MTLLGRYGLSGMLAATVTFALFLLMQILIANSDARLSDKNLGRVVDFVRVKRSENLQVKKRELPTREAAEQEPEPPELQLDAADAAGADVPKVAIHAPQQQQQVRIAGSPHLGGAPSDTDTIPLVRVQPIYPRGAQERKLEGWVRIRFDISTTGTVRNPVVIAADPPNVFERAALRAIRKWKYNPRIENGVPVESRGIQVQLTFALDDEE